ncbi:D-alanyl-D-alanine carboxypeptidase family protein [Candidatus Electronema sp. JM]|uniref:D-alanyl-D-alanine carboxypeptidase family protein n=1 Tax=Candidatus Electronema sp. JM TaxID=3401571 RepID=UPI003AA85BD8
MTASKYRYHILFLNVLAACILAIQVPPAAAVSVLKGGKKHPQAAVQKKQPAASFKAVQKQAGVQQKRQQRRTVRKSNAGRMCRTAPVARSFRDSIRAAISQAEARFAAPADDSGLPITSKSVMILDARTGEPIFSKEADNPRQPASTIKVLTGLIALKRLEENEQVRVSSHAESMPRSKVYLNSGQQYKADDLINAVLLESANDASVALAEKIAGSESSFANLMTLHARLWGAENTICRTASGLTADGQQTTARDLAQIFRHAMQDRNFAERMRMVKTITSYGKLLKNHNKALWQMDGAMGGKTGYTSTARQTYVGQFRRGEDVLVVAIMGSSTMWNDIRRLVDYGFQKKEQLRLAQLGKSGGAAVR